MLRLALAAGAWGVIVLWTGGIDVELGPRHLTSTNYRRPVVLAIALVAVSWLLGPRGLKWRALQEEWEDLAATASRLFSARPSLKHAAAPAIAAIAAAAVFAVGLTRGTNVAGGSDSYCYVSQAHLWTTGSLKAHEPLTQAVDWPFALAAFAPLGYTPRSEEGGVAVPICASGYPLTMAAFERSFGSRAVFWVVPLLASLAVWGTYALGARLAGPGIGAASAALIGTSPVFLLQVTAPMSDVPVAAWWTICLAFAAMRTPTTAFASGLAAAAAILTRPNLVAVVLAPLGYLVWNMRKAERRPVPQVLLFSVPVVAAIASVAVINAAVYGSPGRSGYGTLADIYRLDYFWPNLQRYPRWLVESETPFVVIAAALPLFWRRILRSERTEPGPLVWTIAAVGAITAACYVFYIPFDAWVYLRFLMPAIPLLAVFMAVSLCAVANWLSPGARTFTFVVLVAIVASTRLAFAQDNLVFQQREGERQYEAVGRYIRDRLPEQAVVLSMQQSGSVRYYSGRTTIRYDMIPATALDSVVEDLRRLGRHPYILLYDWEEPDFRSRFSGQSRLAALDWTPIAAMTHPRPIRLYDASPENSSGAAPETDVIP